MNRTTMNSIAVFCGASEGADPAYAAAAFRAGAAIAAQGLRIVYGGACIGLMGQVADGALSAGGEVIGVLPAFLKTREIMHSGLTQLITVGTMHERKLRMHELSDGIVALPGGFGTLEELFEMLTWAQLGLHAKPTGLLNIRGYYDGLAGFLNTMTAEGFLQHSDAQRLVVDTDIDLLLATMASYQPAPAPQWLTEETT